VLHATGYEGGSDAWGYLRVQVASFTEHGPAKALADKLKNRYIDVRIMAIDLPGGRRYRVQVGRFSSERQASAVAREVNAQFDVDSLIIRDDV
jgi:rare lipoprotein A